MKAASSPWARRARFRSGRWPTPPSRSSARSRWPAGDLPQWADAEKIALDERRTALTVTSRRPARTIVEMVKWLDEQGIELADIRIKRPSLEEAFIELTGKSLRE